MANKNEHFPVSTDMGNGDDIRIRKIDDNTYTVDVAVQVSKTFFAWIVGTQGKVKIKAPEKVVTEFSDFVAKIKEVY